jgi:hypothetical protein
MPTSKVANVDEYRHYLWHFFTRMPEALDFYSQHRWTALRWRTQVMQQRTFHKICTQIGGDPTDQSIVIAYGNGCMTMNPSSRGRPAGPTKRLYRETRRRYGTRCRLVDEYLTSQICSLCDGHFGKQRFYHIKACKSVCLVSVMISIDTHGRCIGIAMSTPLEIFVTFSCIWICTMGSVPRRSFVAKSNKPHRGYVVSSRDSSIGW